MPVVLVIIVAAAWIVVLGPRLLRRHTDGTTGTDSISHFHRQLRVLEHSGPRPIVAPAYRLRTLDGSGVAMRAPGSPESGDTPVLTVVGASELPRPALAFLGDESCETVVRTPTGPGRPFTAGPRDTASWQPEPMTGDRRQGAVPLSGEAPLGSLDSDSRQRVCRRRRDTLGVLVMIFFGTLLVGLVPGAGALWIVTGLSGVALVAYVGLLVHLRRMAEERERKLHYLQPSAGAGGGGGLDHGDPAGGRYSHPSYAAEAR